MQAATPPAPEYRTYAPGDGPWLARKDWAAGRIKSEEASQLAVALVMAVALGGMGIATGLRLPGGWHQGNRAAWITLAFSVGSLLCLVSFIKGLRTRRRFGRCCFVPSHVPIPLGGVLVGTIQTGKPLRLEQDLRLTLSCIRNERRGKHSHQSLLWQDEKYYSADANFIETEPGHTDIPVRFKLPGDQPEGRRGGRGAVCWRLEAQSKMRGPSFHECFDLPVFNAPAGPAPATGDDEADPTAGLLAGVEEIRRDQDSRIQVGAGPLGHEFYFPPARNVGFASGMTVAALMFDVASALILASAGRDAHGLMAARPVSRDLFLVGADTFFSIVKCIIGLGFGLFGLGFSCLAFSAWFKSTRVTVDSTGVRADNHWLFIFHRSRHFAADDIDHFEIESRLSSEKRQYWDVQLHLRAQNQPDQAATASAPIILAKKIAGQEEAQSLADQMACALGRQPFPARA